MKSRKNRKGVLEPEQLDGAVPHGAFPGRRDFGTRHPKLMILLINLLKDGKTGQKPRWEDHINIMRQAGLNLDEVSGKIGKNGYLEVALRTKFIKCCRGFERSKQEGGCKVHNTECT